MTNTELQKLVIDGIKLDVMQVLDNSTQAMFNKLIDTGLIEVISTVYDEDHPHDSEGYKIIRVASNYYKVDMQEREYGDIYYPLESLVKAVQKVKEVSYFDWDKGE